MGYAFNYMYCFSEKSLKDRNVALLQLRGKLGCRKGNKYSFTCHPTSVPTSLFSDCVTTLSMISSGISDASGSTLSPGSEAILATLAHSQYEAH